jgi:hypothetical protein
VLASFEDCIVSELEQMARRPNNRCISALRDTGT